jgi:hypothetical protein
MDHGNKPRSQVALVAVRHSLLAGGFARQLLDAILDHEVE